MNKKTFVIALAILLIVTLAFVVSPAAATAIPTPITVTYDFITIDSNTSGTYWAYDTFHSVVQIYDLGDGVYRLVWTDTGTFVSWAGVSPSGTGLVGDNVTGTVIGGQTILVHGALKSELPSYLGFYDYGCDHDANCPGYVSWRTLMFNSVDSYVYEQWGWTYTTCFNGTWVNADTGNIGDITGDPVACPAPPVTWTQTGRTYWRLLMYDTDLSHAGYFDLDHPGKTGKCVIYTNGPVPNVGAQQQYCAAGIDGFTWRTDDADAFIQFTDGLGNFKYKDTDTGEFVLFP